MNELEQLKNRIKQAYNSLPPKEALREIRWIWEQSDDAVGLAEARTRLLLGKMERIDVHGDVIGKLIALVGVMIDIPSDVTVTVTTDGNEVDWRRGDSLIRWSIDISENRWPMVLVYVLSKKGGIRHTRTSRDAFGVIEHLEEWL